MAFHQSLLLCVLLWVFHGSAWLVQHQKPMRLRTAFHSFSDLSVDSTPPPHSFHTLQDFNNQCQHLVTQSLKRFGGEATGGDKYFSHVKEQMGDWIDQTILDDVRLVLNDTSLQTATTFANYLLSSPLPAASTIIDDEHFTLTLLFVPSATETELHTHAPGTVVLYKSVFGTGELKGFNNQRVIQRDVMSPHRYDEKGTPVITRLGGPRRALACGISSSAAIIELAFHPRNKEGISTPSHALNLPTTPHPLTIYCCRHTFSSSCCLLMKAEFLVNNQ